MMSYTETLAVEVVVSLSGEFVGPQVLLQLCGKLLDVLQVVKDVDDTRRPDRRVRLDRRHVARHRRYSPSRIVGK